MTGATGPTGGIGPRGPDGQTGANVYGPTGTSISGITSDSANRILTTYEDGTTQESNPIKGFTGPWQVRVTGTCEGCTNGIFSSFSQSTNLDSDLFTYGDSITLKNIKTNTPSVIGITYDEATNNTIIISYLNILGVTFVDADVKEMVIGASSSALTGANNTHYDTITNSFDMKIRSYFEGITNVQGVVDGNQTTTTWTLLVDEYSVFQLRAPDNITTDKKINISSTLLDGIGRGITIIIPSGITGNTTKIKYKTVTDVVKFPFGIAPHLTNNLDVINMISIGPDNWYANFVVYNGIATEQNIGQLSFFGDIVPTISPTDWATMVDEWPVDNSVYCSRVVGDTYTRPCIEP